MDRLWWAGEGGLSRREQDPWSGLENKQLGPDLQLVHYDHGRYVLMQPDHYTRVWHKLLRCMQLAITGTDFSKSESSMHRNNLCQTRVYNVGPAALGLGMPPLQHVITIDTHVISLRGGI